MGFSEKIIVEVRRKSAFRCCRCQHISIQVHHIIPQEFNGEDIIENAAPLCANCHTDYGSNPEKRKEITQMRDWWYEQVKKQFPDNRQLGLSEEISSKLDELQQKQIGLDDFKKELQGFAKEIIDNMTLGTAATTASGIANTSLVTTSTKLGENVHANMICRKCGTQVGLLIGSNNCPNCGELIVG